MGRKDKDFEDEQDEELDWRAERDAALEDEAGFVNGFDHYDAEAHISRIVSAIATLEAAVLDLNARLDETQAQIYALNRKLRTVASPWVAGLGAIVAFFGGIILGYIAKTFS